MLHSLGGFLADVICCKFKVGRYSPSSAVMDLPPQSVPTTLGASDNFIATPVPGVSLLSQDSASLLAQPSSLPEPSNNLLQGEQ